MSCTRLCKPCGRAGSNVDDDDDDGCSCDGVIAECPVPISASPVVALVMMMMTVVVEMVVVVMMSLQSVLYHQCKPCGRACINVDDDDDDDGCVGGDGSGFDDVITECPVPVCANPVVVLVVTLMMMTVVLVEMVAVVMMSLQSVLYT